MPYNENIPTDAYDAKIEALKKALIANEGFITAAAEEAGISRDTASRWIKQNPRLKRLVKRLRKERRGEYDDPREHNDYD